MQIIDRVAALMFRLGLILSYHGLVHVGSQCRAAGVDNAEEVTSILLVGPLVQDVCQLVLLGGRRFDGGEMC